MYVCVIVCVCVQAKFPPPSPCASLGRQMQRRHAVPLPGRLDRELWMRQQDLHTGNTDKLGMSRKT